MTLAGQTILVTGATGFLGGVLVRHLSDQGAHVRALARRPERDRYIHDVAQVEIVSGDIRDSARMREVMTGCGYVLHAAAVASGTMRHQRAINVEGTRNIMEAAAEAKVKRVVHISSIAVYGFRYTHDITEKLPPNPNKDPYNITKAEAEQVVREVSTQYDLSHSIIRPGMVYGPRSGMWTRQMFRLAKRSPTPFIGDGSGLAPVVYVDDVASLILLVATHPAAHDQIFNCTPDPAPTWREFLGAYSKLAGHNRWRGLPPGPVRGIARIIELFLTLRGEPKDLPDLVPFVQRRITYRMTKAYKLLGWHPDVDLETGIQRCVPYLREKGLLP